MSAATAGAHGLPLGGFGEVLRIRDFRLLFWGQAVSSLGDWVGTFAFIVAARQLAPNEDSQSLAAGAVLVIRLVPSFFAPLIGGVLSDRTDRKRIMILSDVARFFVILAVPFVPNIGALYAFAFATEAISMLFLPARDATVPNLVGTNRLEAANALVMGSSFGGIPLAAPIFALLALAGEHYPGWLPLSEEIHRYTFAFPFIFDAFTYLVSAAILARITIPPTVHEHQAEDESLLDALREGARRLSRSPFLRGLAAAVTVGMLGGGVLFAVGVNYVNDTLGGGTVAFGWLMGIFGGGMVLGFLVSQIKMDTAWMVRTSLVAMGAILGVMSLISALWIGYVMALGFGVAFSVSVIIAMSGVQAYAEDEVRGRIMASVHMLVRVSLSVGALGGGVIAAVVPEGAIDIAFYEPDPNQVALLVSGGLIALGSLAVRSPGDGDRRAA